MFNRLRPRPPFAGPWQDDRFAVLTSRERDVLGGIVAGGSNAEIAASLCISEKTVRNIVSRMFEKLNVRSRAQAIVMARDHGFEARRADVDARRP
jgi:DNA-binding NarL/FixJ family response regulator